VATATPTHRPSFTHSTTPPKNPIILWHILSLDAPTVATLWTWFVAHTIPLTLPTFSLLAMFLAVWLLYAADRILDARIIDTHLIASPTTTGLEARHLFHHHHRRAFLTGIAIAATTLALLLPRLEAAAIHLYLILGAFLAAYFIFIHATDSAHRLPKEIAVGIFFAAATFIPTVARRPDLRLTLLPSAILFATLCSLNCLFIYAWEHDHLQQAHPITRLALRHLPFLAILITLTGATLPTLNHHTLWPIPLATALSSTLLLLLHRYRRTIAPTTLRACADLALLIPILFLPFLPR
jgi:hypothetical protein